MEPLLTSPSFDLSWDSSRGLLLLASPGRNLALTAGVEVLQGGHARTVASEDLTAGRVSEASIVDAHGAVDQIEVCFQEARGVALQLRARLYPSRPFALLQLVLTNVGPQPMDVRRFFVRTAQGGIRASGDPTGIYTNGWQSASPAGYCPLIDRSVQLPKWCRLTAASVLPEVQLSRKGARSGRWWSDTVGAIATAREALIVGGASLADQFVQVTGHVDPTWSDHCSVMVQSQADDSPLAAGTSRTSEWFYLEWVPLPNTDPFAQYAFAVVRQMQVPSPRPPVGGWSSLHLPDERVAEADVMENLASAALLADEVPLTIIQLDRGYHDPAGDWDALNPRFPHTLKWLSDRVTGSRFAAGLWLSPLVASSRSALVREHPEVLLCGRRGKPVRLGPLPDQGCRALDPTHPLVQEHIHDMVDRAVHDWGYSYLKLDMMYAGALHGARYDASITRAQSLRRAFQIAREAAGPATYLVGCGSPLSPAIGLVDAMRISPDAAPVWQAGHRPFRSWLRGGAAAPSLQPSVRNVITRTWMHNRWWVNDPDSLLLRDAPTRLTSDEVLAHLTLVGLSGGSVMLSDDLDNLLPERRAWAAALFPQLLDGMDVLDLFESAMPEVVVVPVARPWGRWQLIGLLNWSADPVEVMLPDPIQLDPRKAYHLVDFWERRYVQLRPGALRPVFHLAPHGASLLGLRMVSADPHLVATTFHISQGAEVNQCAVEPTRMTLSIDIGRRASGELWLALPSRPSVVAVGDQQLSPDAVRAIAAGVWAIPCRINRSAVIVVDWAPLDRSPTPAQ